MQYGTIIGVNIREDRLTGKPKGFAFVTFEDDEAATRAISSMNNYSYGGRTLTVNQASIRGSDVKNESDVDNSWKTVPTPAPSAAKGKKADGKDGKKTAANGKTAKPQATWDHWAGPVAKAATVKAPAVKAQAAPKVAPAEATKA